MIIKSLLPVVLVLQIFFFGRLTASDVETGTEKVTVQFMGASGGMKVFDKSKPERWIMVQQEKLEELSSEKGKSNKLTMTNGDWTALQKRTTGDIDTYTTTYTKKMDDTKFSLTAHISTGESTVTEPIPCSGCTSGAGFCSKTISSGNVTEVTCQEDEPSNTCPEGFSKCEESVVIPKDELKFSIQISDWPFLSKESKLIYAIVLKQKDSGGNNVTESGKSTKRLEIADGGYLVLPSSGKIVGGNTTEDIEIGISTEIQGSKFIINFEFPYFEPGTTLYYDPNLGVSTEDDPTGGSGTENSAPINSAPYIGLLIAFLTFLLFN